MVPVPGTTPPAQVTPGDAMAALWQRARVSAKERTSRLERLSLDATHGALDEAGREEGERLAHQLAGSLGTFGLPRGSELARALEHLLGELPRDEGARQRMAELVAGLRIVLDLDQPVGGPVVAHAASGVIVITPEGGRLAAAADGLVERGRRVRMVDPGQAAIEPARPGPPALVVVDLETFDEQVRSLVDRLVLGSPGTTVAGCFAPDADLDRVALVRAGVHVLVGLDRSPAELVDALDEQVPRAATSAGTVLAVDDDPLMLAVLETLLGSAGLDLVTVEDPSAVWEQLEASAPDLVVLDLQLPGVSGAEICRAIRMDPRFMTLPVLFLTATGDPATVTEVFAAGADDFVRKPIIGPELLTRINNRLERGRLLRERFETDVVTGVTSRLKAQEDLGRLVAAAQRRGDPLSVSIVDLDRFKQVNDIFGHATGDAVLREFGSVLRAMVRAHDLVARWGGKEFLLALPGASREEAAVRLEALLVDWRSTALTATDGTLFTSTFSAGVAELGRDGDDVTTVCRAADVALYEAKSTGRARVLTR